MSDKTGQSPSRSKLIPAVIGIASGLLNGLFGSGGGALVVPASQRFMGADAHEAHASAIAVMLPMSLVSAVMYTIQTKPDYIAVLAVSAGGVAGGLLGARLMPRLPAKALGRIFGVFIAVAGLRMIL